MFCFVRARGKFSLLALFLATFFFAGGDALLGVGGEPVSGLCLFYFCCYPRREYWRAPSACSTGRGVIIAPVCGVNEESNLRVGGKDMCITQCSHPAVYQGI